MSRLIDADALIADMQERYCKPCKERKEDYNEVRCRACWVDDAIGEVDGFADNTIDAVSEWIPCEERLPNRQGHYICTCKDGSKYKRTTTVKWSNGWQLTGARAYWIVLAWMPLPEPWK